MARLTQDDNAFALFRGAFTTSLTPDGVSIVNAAHPLINGSTTSNLITGALTQITLNTAMVALIEQVNQANVLVGCDPAYLLVSATGLKNAIEITQSVLISDSANNNLNIYRSIVGLEVMWSKYLGAKASGSDTAWFLISDRHGIIRVVRQGVQTALRSWEYSDNRTYFYQGNFREEVYCQDYIGIVGSLGT
jgi:hypothetical protein